MVTSLKTWTKAEITH